MRWFLLLLVVGAFSCAKACDKKKANNPSFSCAELQSRAATCEQQALDLFRLSVKLDAKTSTGAQKHTTMQYAMLEHRFKKRLKEKVFEAQCNKFMSAGSSAERQRKRMKRCFQAKDCKTFASCMLDFKPR